MLAQEIGGQMGRRKFGHDPHKHGRFIIIVEQREIKYVKDSKKNYILGIGRMGRILK